MLCSFNNPIIPSVTLVSPSRSKGSCSKNAASLKHSSMCLNYFNQSILACLLQEEENPVSREVLRSRWTSNICMFQSSISSMLPYLNYYEKAKSISHHISLLLAIFKDSFMPLIFISLIERLHQLETCYPGNS